MAKTSVSFIGFGEAARAFAGGSGWRAGASAYDIKTTLDPYRDEMIHAYAQYDVSAYGGLKDLVPEASSIISLVTADQALSVAREAAVSLQPGTCFFDMNSVSPGTKKEAARAIGEAGGHYIDVAVMSPVHPKRLDTPLLVSGQTAEEAEKRLLAFGFRHVRTVGQEVGLASSIKMIRSVMIKGIEALTAECFLAAEASGVTGHILASLGEEWEARADYNFDRMMVHGGRRAAEMAEVTRTIEDLGLPASMSAAATGWQSLMGGLSLAAPPEGLRAKLSVISDAMNRRPSS